MTPSMLPPPSHEDSVLAKASSSHLARFIKKDSSLSIKLPDNEVLELPSLAVELLMEILKSMASGHALTLIPANAELSTVQAAETLNVSRPFLIKLLEQGEIPHRKVGKHRRVRLEDILAYKNQIDTERETILDKLAAEAQEENMGYNPE